MGSQRIGSKAIPDQIFLAGTQDFPYNFEEGVMHHNIWSEVPLSHEEILKVGIQSRINWRFAAIAILDTDRFERVDVVGNPKAQGRLGIPLLG